MLSFALYALGLIALFFSDILVTAFLTAEEIVEWAEIRSLVGISGLFCLIGLEMVFIRSPQSSARLMARLKVQIPLLAAPVGIVVHWLGYLDGYLQAYLMAVGSAGTIALYQYYRSHHLRSMAQLTQQGWRMAVFFLVLYLIWRPGSVPLGQAVVFLLVLVLALSAIAVLRFPPSRLHRQEPVPMGDMYRIGWRFMVTSVFLALSVYAEQLVIQRFGTTDEAALYFSHAAYFLFPAGVVNGYLGFLLGPWVRENHDRFIGILSNRWALIFGAVAVYAALLHGVGLVAWSIMAPGVGDPDTILRLVFLLTSMAITLYQFPSAYNGVFAQTRHHDVLILAQVFALASACVVFWALLRGLQVMPIISVAAGALTNWVLRTSLGLAVLSVVSSARRGR